MKNSQNMINEPIELPCGAKIKNRIAKSAMSENFASKNHVPGGKFVKLYETWAKGGAGLLMSGNIMIDSDALGEPNNVVIEKGHENLEELKAWAASATLHNTHLWGQLNHPGKQSPKFLSKETVAPSAIAYKFPLNKGFHCPRALEDSEIEGIINRFGYAAKILKSAGFTGVQIHGAHGYLVSQFLSPHHNQRQDKWGGSIENRMRFVLEVYEAIRESVGKNFPVGIKLNSADFQKGGFSEEESLVVAQTLSEAGVDLIEVSGGTYEAPVMMKNKKSTQVREAYFLDYCEKIAGKVKTPIMLTGGFRTKEGMEKALLSQACQMIGLGRSLALDPDFPNKILQGSAEAISQVKPLTTGFKKLDKLIPIEITWYTQQLQRLGEGKSSDPNANVCLSILRSMGQYGLQSIERVRAN